MAMVICIQDQKGQPVENVKLIVSLSGERDITGFTNKEGRFVVSIGPKKGTIWIGGAKVVEKKNDIFLPIVVISREKSSYGSFSFVPISY